MEEIAAELRRGKALGKRWHSSSALMEEWNFNTSPVLHRMDSEMRFGKPKVLVSYDPLNT